MTATPTAATPPASDVPPDRQDRQGHLGGKWLVIATLSLFLVVPPLVYVAKQALESIEPPAPTRLVWADRAAWAVQPVQPFTIEQNPMSSMRTGGTRFKPIEFAVTEKVEASLLAAADLARRPAFADASSDIDGRLRTLLAQTPEAHRFYVRFLLAQRAAASGDTQAADELREQAFLGANRALVVPFLDASGQPAANADVGPLTIAFDRIVDDTIDPSLALVYPGLRTDDAGRVYLPVYHTVYRVVEPSDPVGQADPKSMAWYAAPSHAGLMPARRIPAGPADAGPASNTRPDPIPSPAD